MISNLKQYRDYAFVFLIPNVSHLLIYKDNWSKGKVMRKVVSELLGTAKLVKLYLGSPSDTNIAKYRTVQNDCALVTIELHHVNLLNYQPKTVEELFAKELRNEVNRLQFNNEWIDAENNVSSINLSIEIRRSRRKSKSIQAA